MNITLVELVIGLLVTFVGVVAQTSIGFGYGVISVPLLALVEPTMVPVPQLLLTFPLAGLMIRRERAHIDVTGVRWILLGRLVGGVAAVPLLAVLSGRTRELAIGIVVLLLVGVASSRFSLPIRCYTQIGAGALSGVTALLASIGGPPLAILYRNETGARLRSSLATIMVVGLTLTLVLRIISSEITTRDVWIALALLPGLIVGLVVGVRLVPRIDRKGLRTCVLVGSAAASVVLIVKALLA